MKKLIAVAAIIAIIQVSCSNSGQAGKGLFDKGITELKAGNPDKALEIFDSILSKYPESPYGWHGKSIYYEKEGFIYEAIDANLKVSADYPDFLPALMQNSRLYMSINRPELAFLSAALYQEDGGDKSIGASRGAEILMAAGKIDDAEIILDKALDETPDDPLLLITRGRCHLHSGDFERGLERCTRALSFGEGAPEILKKAGDFYQALGLFDSAASYYNKSLQEAENDFYHKADIAQSLIDMKYFHRANKLIKEFGAKVGGTHRYYLLKANLLRQQGKLRNAMEEYGMIVPKHPKSLTVLGNFAFAKSRIGDGLGARQYFENALISSEHKGFPDIIQNALLLDYIDMFIESEKLRQAGSYVERLSSDLQGDFRALHSAAFFYRAYRAENELRETLRKMNKSAEGNPSNMAILGSFYTEMDSLLKAHDIFMQVLGSDMLNQTAILGEIEIQKKKSGLSEAIAFLNSFNEYISYNPEIASEKLASYEQMGEHSSAMQFAEKLIDIGREDIDRYRVAARLAVEMGNTDKAKDIYRMCLDNNPDDPDAYALVGEYDLRSQDYPGAEKNISKAIELDSLHTEGLTLWAELNAIRGRKDSAIALYKKIIEIDQYAGDALGNLALLLVERGENPLIPANYAKKAIMYDRDNPKHHYALGRAYFKRGKYAMARGSFEKALKLAPENPEYNFYAGINYIKDDKRDKAGKCLNKSIRNGLKGKLKNEAEKALKGIK